MCYLSRRRRGVGLQQRRLPARVRFYFGVATERMPTRIATASCEWLRDKT